MNQAIEVLSPNRVISKQTVRWMVGFQLLMLFFIWVFSPTVFLPKPKEVWQALGEMWMQGLGGELITSFILNLEAIALATLLSLLMAYLTVIPFFRPIVTLLSKLRFLSMVGLTFFFTLMASTGHELKLFLLVFSVSVFFCHRHGRGGRQHPQRESSTWRARCAWANGASSTKSLCSARRTKLSKSCARTPPWDG